MSKDLGDIWDEAWWSEITVECSFALLQKRLLTAMLYLQYCVKHSGTYMLMQEGAFRAHE